MSNKVTSTKAAAAHSYTFKDVVEAVSKMKNPAPSPYDRGVETGCKLCGCGPNCMGTRALVRGYGGKAKPIDADIKQLNGGNDTDRQ